MTDIAHGSVDLARRAQAVVSDAETAQQAVAMLNGVSIVASELAVALGRLIREAEIVNALHGLGDVRPEK